MKFLVTATFLFMLAACGKSNSSENQEENETHNQNGTPLTADAAFAVTDAVFASDNIAVATDEFSRCSKDLSTGLLSVFIGNSTKSLEVQIKNVSNSAKEYGCKQAANNSQSQGSLGDKFNSCMVDVRLTPEDAAGASGYSMHRATADFAPFTYSGDCSVSISEIDDSVSGTFACGDMIQTYLESSYRNPVDAAITANVSGDFSCVLVKR
jgi:hypothetical protein